MRHRQPGNRGGSMIEFTLLVPVWLPLLIGTMWIGSAMIRGQQTSQMARDLASMYSRGVNFSTAGGSASNETLTKITQQLGTLTASGNGVIYFSTITYSGNSFCTSAGNPTYGTISGCDARAYAQLRVFARGIRRPLPRRRAPRRHLAHARAGGATRVAFSHPN